jgi:hypothetical protein
MANQAGIYPVEGEIWLSLMLVQHVIDNSGDALDIMYTFFLPESESGVFSVTCLCGEVTLGQLPAGYATELSSKLLYELSSKPIRSLLSLFRNVPPKFQT